MVMKTRMIVMASQEKINALGDKVDKVLTALGHPEALVTDESTVWDFIFDEADLHDISSRLGFDVHGDDYVWELAEKLED